MSAGKLVGGLVQSSYEEEAHHGGGLAPADSATVLVLDCGMGADDLRPFREALPPSRAALRLCYSQDGASTGSRGSECSAGLDASTKDPHKAQKTTQAAQQ